MNFTRAQGLRAAVGFVAIVCGTMLTACGGGDSGPPTLQSVEIAPTAPSAAAGTTAALGATAVYSDGARKDVTSTASWTSSATNIASVTSLGVVTGVTQGTATISAVYEGKSGATVFTVTAATVVSVAVSPDAPSAPSGTTQQFKATASYSDNTSQDVTTGASWSSSNTAVATISNASGSIGLAAVTGTGTAGISAQYRGVTGSTTLTGTSASLVSVQITPASSSVPAGFSRALTATGIYSDGSKQDITATVSWSAANTGVATVSNVDGSRGLVTGVAAGSTAVTAQQGTVSSFISLKVTSAKLQAIQVSPNAPTLPKGLSQQFTATGVFSDSSTLDLTAQVSWSSSATAVATISNSPGTPGLAQTLAEGTSTVTAGYAGTGGSVSGKTTLTVSAATLVSLAISAKGDATSVPIGETLNYTAIGTYTDATTSDLTSSVTWTSSETAAATINSSGIAKGVATGPTVISASSRSITSNSLALDVTAAVLKSISISTPSSSVPLGLNAQFTATGTYSDATSRDVTTEVTWASDNAAVATISNASGSNGLASTLSVGTANIVASGAGVQSAATKLTVSNVALLSIAVSPADVTLPLGTTLQFRATGIYSDASTQDLTTQVTWAVVDSSIADVDNSSGKQGIVSANAKGTTSLKATDPVSAVTGKADFTVGDAQLLSISVGFTGDNATVPAGYSVQAIATGRYSDGTTSDVTVACTWSTFDTPIAVVSNSAGSIGQVTGLSAGATTVLAQLGGISSFSTLNVSNATLSKITVTPANQTIKPRTTLQYLATGEFSDGSTLDLTTQVAWSSSQTSVATISNASGTQGLATAGASQGTTTISATLNGATGTTTLTRSLF